MLAARIASALNKIIHQLEEQKVQKEDRLLRGRQIANMIYDYFQVTGAHDTVLDYADLFTIVLRNDDIQEFDSKWDEIQIKNTIINDKNWLSQIEDNGEKNYRAESTNKEFWSQKRKLWDERRGQESGNKIAWTMDSRILLAVENQRAVF